MIVEILKTDKRLKVRKGHWYVAEPYFVDPATKVTLLSRITKKTLQRFGKDPMCNQYRSEVKIIMRGI
jgi:hypothetical protein